MVQRHRIQDSQRDIPSLSVTLATSRPALLFVTRRPPFPVTNGSRLRTHRLIVGLSRHFEVTLLTPAHGSASRDGQCSLDDLRASLPGIDIVTCPGLRRDGRTSQLISLVRRPSWAWGRYLGQAFTDAIDAQHAALQPRIVHFDELAPALAGPLPGTLNVYASHNFEELMSARMAASARGLRRMFNTIELRKVKQEERRVLRQMDLVLAVSDAEREAMAEHSSAPVVVCPNGTDPCRPAPLRSWAAGEEFRLLFVGSLDYQPYRRGVRWFIERVLPLFPNGEVRLDLIGDPPSDPIVSPAVHYQGRVDDVGPWYDQAHAVIAPIFDGAGTRLKVVEAAARRRPLLCTRLGAEGLPVEPDVHFLTFEDADGCRQAIARLQALYQARQPELARLVDGAEQAVADLYWPRITERLADTYLRLIDERPRR